MKNLTQSPLVKAEYNQSAIDIGLKFISEQNAIFMSIDSYSGNGDGMTHLMMSLAEELHRTGMRVAEYSAVRLLQDAAADGSLLDRLTESDCLVLDDINFLFDKSTSVSSAIFEMLAARNVSGKKTIFTVAIAANDIESAIPKPYLNLLYSGVICRLGTPSLADKINIAMVKVDQLDISFDKVVNVIIEQAGNIRELEGMLIQYAALQSMGLKAETGGA